MITDLEGEKISLINLIVVDMSFTLKWGIICTSILVFLVTMMVFSAGCITEPEVPQFCNESDCHDVATPEESLSYFELGVDETHNGKKMAQVFTKNITTNFPSFSEDLNVARVAHAPIPGKGFGARTSSVQSINETYALLNVSIKYPSGKKVFRDVPFIFEEGRWRIDMSPKYL